MILQLLYLPLRFFCPSLFPYQTLTYYLAAPPKRSSGYREKEFDRLLFHFLKKGFKLISIQTQGHNTESAAGMWVIATVRAIKPQRVIDLTQDFIPNQDDSGEIDGLYYIQD